MELKEIFKQNNGVELDQCSISRNLNWMKYFGGKEIAASIGFEMQLVLDYLSSNLTSFLHTSYVRSKLC